MDYGGKCQEEKASRCGEKWGNGNSLSKREAVAAEGLEESEAPATMRIALLTKRAKVKREIASSAME